MQHRHRLHPGFTYHVYNRGNNRTNLFLEDENYDYFLHLYVKHVAPAVHTYAYCLLVNHFHFAIHVLPGAGVRSLSQRFSNFFNAYARSFNRRYRRTGSLFERPFERSPVLADSDLKDLIVYIHRNPTHHAMEEYHRWPYSSFQALQNERDGIVQPGRVLRLFGSRDEFLRSHSFPMLDAL